MKIKIRVSPCFARCGRRADLSQYGDGRTGTVYKVEMHAEAVGPASSPVPEMKATMDRLASKAATDSHNRRKFEGPGETEDALKPMGLRRVLYAISPDIPWPLLLGVYDGFVKFTPPTPGPSRGAARPAMFSCVWHAREWGRWRVSRKKQGNLLDELGLVAGVVFPDPNIEIGAPAADEQRIELLTTRSHCVKFEARSRSLQCFVLQIELPSRFLFPYAFAHNYQRNYDHLIMQISDLLLHMWSNLGWQPILHDLMPEGIPTDWRRGFSLTLR